MPPIYFSSQEQQLTFEMSEISVEVSTRKQRGIMQDRPLWERESWEWKASATARPKILKGDTTVVWTSIKGNGEVVDMEIGGLES